MHLPWWHREKHSTNAFPTQYYSLQYTLHQPSICRPTTHHPELSNLWSRALMATIFDIGCLEMRHICKKNLQNISTFWGLWFFFISVSIYNIRLGKSIALPNLIHYDMYVENIRRSQWPRGLRRRSAAARLLRSWVRITMGGLDVCLLRLLCVVR